MEHGAILGSGSSPAPCRKSKAAKNVSTSPINQTQPHICISAGQILPKPRIALPELPPMAVRARLWTSEQAVGQNVSISAISKPYRSRAVAGQCRSAAPRGRGDHRRGHADPDRQQGPDPCALVDRRPGPRQPGRGSGDLPPRWRPRRDAGTGRRSRRDDRCAGPDAQPYRTPPPASRTAASVHPDRGAGRGAGRGHLLAARCHAPPCHQRRAQGQARRDR